MIAAAISWVTTPAFSVFMNNLTSDEATVLASQLQSKNIPYQYDQATGTMMVLSDQLRHARSQLAVRDLLIDNFSSTSDVEPYTTTDYYRSVSNQEQPGFPNHLLEIELAKSIASIDSVQSARLHLALVDPGSNTSGQISRASVVVRVYPGRTLNETQISSISHLIASSAPNLSTDNITIIDQSGKLLKASGVLNASGLSTDQFSYLRQVEQSYADRIENMLEPILGDNAIRVQVVADIEFNTLNRNSVQQEQGHAGKMETSHLRHLAATVIVDHHVTDSGNGRLIRVKRSSSELSRITELVKHAIGFNENRGDVVNVINEPFRLQSDNPSNQVNSIWTRIAYNATSWYLWAGTLVLLVGLIALKLVRSGSSGSDGHGSTLQRKATDDQDPGKLGQIGNVADAESVTVQKADKKGLENTVKKARQYVLDDPKFVAQIIKGWVKEGG